MNPSLLSQIEAAREKSKALEITGAEFKAHCESALSLMMPFVDQVGTAPGYPAQASRPISASLAGEGSAEGPVERLVLSQLEGGIETASGNFMGYIPGGGLLTGALADLVAATTNRYAGFHFTAPGAAEAENKVIHWLVDLFHMGPEAWGCLTSGGTMATLNCLLAARDSVGQAPVEELVIYLSSQAHHSAMRTIKTLGLHKAKIHLVEMDAQGRMRADKLDEAISSHTRQGLKPFLIIATAGTTNTGAFDPLDAIASISRKHGTWLHLDAAYGGFFVLCDEAKDLFSGIEQVDSIAVDPHKGMFLPYGVGACLVKDHKILKAALQEDAPYLAHEASEQMRSPADYSFELTRHNRAPRVQLSLEMFGEEAFTEALREKLLLARYLAEKLSGIRSLELFSEPELSIVAFRAESEAATQSLLNFILEDGATHLSSTRINGQLWIRACVMSFRTHLEHVDRLVERVKKWKDKP